MNTVHRETSAIDYAPEEQLWCEAERQLGEVLRDVRRLDCNVHSTASPLLGTLHALTRQVLDTQREGQYEQIGRFLARVLGTMLYAPELAKGAELLASELVRHNENSDEPEELLLLQAALTVMQYQTDARSNGLNTRIGTLLQSVSAVLEASVSSAATTEGMEPGDSFLRLLAGCLNFVSGRLDRTLELYDRYGYQVSRDFPLWHDLFCMYTSLAALYCHRFPMSLGIVESFRNTAEITGSSRQSLFWRVHLSFLLLRMDRLQEALPHIDHVVTVAASSGMRHIHSVGNRALALYHYKNGNAEAAAHLLVADSERMRSCNLTAPPVTDPVVMEMLFDLQVWKKFSIHGYEIEHELQRLEQGPNVFLRGIGFCLRGRLAQKQLDRVTAVEMVRRGFQELLHSGSLSECMRVGLELERLLGDVGLRDEQSRLQGRLSHLREALPQENLGVAITGGQQAGTVTDIHEANILSLRRCLVALTGLPMEGTGAENLSRLAGVLRHELSAQRVLLLRGTPCGGFEYAAASNLTEVEMRSVDFRRVLQPLQAFCRQAIPEQPVLWRRQERGTGVAVGLAVFVSGSMPWLLYMDNSLGTGDFTAITQDTACLFCAAVAAEIRGILRGSESCDRRTGAAASARVDRAERTNRVPPLFGEGLRAVLDDAERAAETSASVLLLGETGVGKEILARYIHERSGCSGSFVPVHLACISEHLFESELFGHEKGAFTGAVRAKTGLVELAHNGVLFLDEVGDIPLSFQIKLLRFLQEREFMRVGGLQTLRADFRLITATNQNLTEAVRMGRFREDLYHRLAVIPLCIPPLRDRKDDIVPLARVFRRYYAEMHHRSGQFPSDAQIAALSEGLWPGNIRELQGVVERAVVLERWQHKGAEPLPTVAVAPCSPEPQDNCVAPLMDMFPTAEELLQAYIKQVLEKTGGKIYGPNGAVAILGMNKSTLYARMKKMGL